MGMKHSEEKIALQAIEFWSTVCELETELAWEASEVWIRHSFVPNENLTMVVGQRVW